SDAGVVHADTVCSPQSSVSKMSCVQSIIEAVHVPCAGGRRRGIPEMWNSGRELGRRYRCGDVPAYCGARRSGICRVCNTAQCQDAEIKEINADKIAQCTWPGVRRVVVVDTARRPWSRVTNQQIVERPHRGGAWDKQWSLGNYKCLGRCNRSGESK